MRYLNLIAGFLCGRIQRAVVDGVSSEEFGSVFIVPQVSVLDLFPFTFLRFLLILFWVMMIITILILICSDDSSVRGNSRCRNIHLI